MTKRELETTMIRIAQAVQGMVEAYNPEANHIGIDIINGVICVNACQYDDYEMRMIEENILDAVLFADGTHRFGDEYIHPGEGVA